VSAKSRHNWPKECATRLTFPTSEHGPPHYMNERTGKAFCKNCMTRPGFWKTLFDSPEQAIRRDKPIELLIPNDVEDQT